MLTAHLPASLFGSTGAEVVRQPRDPAGDDALADAELPVGLGLVCQRLLRGRGQPGDAGSQVQDARTGEHDWKTDHSADW